MGHTLPNGAVRIGYPVPVIVHPVPRIGHPNNDRRWGHPVLAHVPAAVGVQKFASIMGSLHYFLLTSYLTSGVYKR